MKKLISLGIFLIVIFSFSACGGYMYNGETNFGSVEELQKAAPDFYYFDFELDNIELTKCRGSEFKTGLGCSSQKTYEDLWISYNPKLQGNLTFLRVRLECSKWKKSIEEYIEEDFSGEYLNKYFVDNIDCSFFYEEGEHWTVIYVFFEIDSIAYYFDISVVASQQFAEEVTSDFFVDYALSITRSAIENRHKGPKE